MEGTATQWIYRSSPFLTGIIVIIITFLVASLVRRFFRRLFNRTPLDETVEKVIQSVAVFAVYLLGILTGLGTMGIKVAPLIAGLGLGGFALGFALKDALSNFLAGMMVLVYRPFTTGDRISVAGAEGTVTEINLRYTVLVSSEAKIMIPNSLIFTNAIRMPTPDQGNKSETQ